MEKMLVFFFLLATAYALSTNPAGFEDDEPEGHGSCHPPAPVFTNMNMSKFDGLWYLDSSTLSSWGTEKCNAYQFHYIDSPFTHHNRTYPGVLNYHLKQHYSYPKCWTGCAFPLQGYLHGWLANTDIDQCNFGKEQTLTTDSATTSYQSADPCHPHGRWKWDLWLLRTNYKTYSLVWLCAGTHSYAMLLSRSKQGLSTQQRQAAENYLRHYNFHGRFYITHNTGC